VRALDNLVYQPRKTKQLGALGPNHTDNARLGELRLKVVKGRKRKKDVSDLIQVKAGNQPRIFQNLLPRGPGSVALERFDERSL
jgi:hypothetical protein